MTVETRAETPDLGSGHLDRAFGEAVYLQMFRSRRSQAQVALCMGISQSAFSRKMRGMSQWTLGDMVAVAEELQVPLALLMPARMDQVLYGSAAGTVRADVDREWAPWDSNPQPTDYGRVLRGPWGGEAA